MNSNYLSPGVLVALTGRDPGDSIVQATLVQHLQVLDVDPADVVVAHATGVEPQPSGWFTDVRHCHRGSFIVRHVTLLRTVVSLLRSRSVAAIYARDVITMQVALFARWVARDEVAVIFDCRGDIAAEAELRGTSRAKVAILSRMQKRSWRRADRVMVVSGVLRGLVAKDAPHTPVVVVPNLQPRRLSVVEEIPPRPLVVFAGGAQAWQHSAGVIRDLASLRESGIDVEIITRDTAFMHQAGELGFTVSSGGRAHVLARLQRATASWMVRVDATANSVASPIKLGEALSAGAMVIGSQATWERMPELALDKLAIMIPSEGGREHLVSELFDVWAQGVEGRVRRLEMVRQNWTLQAYYCELVDFYGVIAGSANE